MKDRVFFRDKSNVLKGPFNEREVQKWYRERWFENSFPFYFMKDDEEPSDETESYTLEELLNLNGTGCPFRWTDQPLNRGQENAKCGLEARIEEIEKSLTHLRSQVDSLRSLEERIDKLEKMIEDTNEEPVVQETKPVVEGLLAPNLNVSFNEEPKPPVDLPVTSHESLHIQLQQMGITDTETSDGSQAESGQSTTLAPLRLHVSAATIPKDVKEATRRFVVDLIDLNKDINYSDLLASWFVKIVGEYLESCSDGSSTLQNRFPHVPSVQIFLGWLDREIGNSEAAKFRIKAALTAMLRNKKHYYCCFCQIATHNCSQTISHIMHSTHWNTIVDETYKTLGATLHSMYREEGQIWFNSAKFVSSEVTHKYLVNWRRVGRDNMRPSLPFLESLKTSYDDVLFSTEGTEAAKIKAACAILEGSEGKKILNKIRRNIGDELTMCDSCEELTGKGDEYYKHLLTYEHVSRTSPRDIPTLVINILKGEMFQEIEEAIRLKLSYLRRAEGRS